LKIASYSITNDHQLKCAHEELDRQWTEHDLIEMELSFEKHRSQKQSKMIYALYQKATRTQRGEGSTATDIRAFCKLTMGIPILYTEDAKFRKWYRKNVKDRYSYEEKLESMVDGYKPFPVTSLMSVQQVSQYTKKIMDTYGIY